MIRHRFIATVLCHLVLGCAVVAAQETGNGKVDPAKPAETTALQPGPLKTITLMDENGAPRTLLEVLQRYADQAMQGGNESGYEILSLEATGDVPEGANHAKLTVTLRIAVNRGRDEWVTIPLRFDQAAFSALPDAAKNENQRIGFQSRNEADATTDTRRGYVLWIRGRGEPFEETISLVFSVPLTGIGQENRLVLSVPRALKSKLTLLVPMADAVAKVSDGIELTQRASNKSTELALSGFQNEIDLRWGKRNGNTAEAAPVLTATGEIKASVALNSVTFEVKLTVRVDCPSGQQVSSFRVCLPPGAVLMDERSPKYTLTVVPPADASPHEGQLVEVSFPEPLEDTKSASVSFRAMSNKDPASKGLLAPAGLAADGFRVRDRILRAAKGQFSLAGFEVLEAVDQTGWIEVYARGNWDVRCEPGRGVKPEMQASSSRSPENLVARYGYHEQPFSLAARVFPKQVRIKAEPRHEISIEPGMARLAATLKYAVRGDKANQLKIDLKGWEFDRVGPEERVVPEACGLDESGMLVIRLQEGLTSEFELTLNAHRAIEPTERSLMLRLPKPEATSLSSTALAVLPADNIELRDVKVLGLERQKGPPPAWLQPRGFQQEPLCFLGETDELGEASFAATMNIRKQEISVDLSTEVGIAAGKATVRERLSYEVKYEPANALSIRVPAELGVEYSLDGQAVSAVSSEQSTAAEGPISRRIVLPGPRQGRLELTADYTVPIEKLEPLTSVSCIVPLIVPEGATFTGHRLRATVESGIGIWVRGSVWQEVGNQRGSYAAATITEFAADTPENCIMLGVHPVDLDTLGSAVIDAAWLQTIMTSSERRDRAVYRFTSDRNRLTVSLPNGADTNRLVVRLDGKELRREADYSLEPDLKLRVNLAPEEAPRERVLDLGFFSRSRPPRGRMHVELPGLAEDVWVRRCYWQLVLPGNEHIVTGPKDYTAEYEWKWNRLWWGRTPTMEQADLEELVQVDSEAPVPRGMSQYLFSAFGPAKPVDLVTACRSWIVGGASGLALLIGLAVIYLPAARHPLAGLVAVIAVVGAAVVWPGASLLAAQAAGMGLVLSLLGAILYRGVAKRRRRTVRRDLAGPVAEKDSAQTLFGSSEVEILRPTANEPDAAAVQAPEG